MKGRNKNASDNLKRPSFEKTPSAIEPAPHALKVAQLTALKKIRAQQPNAKNSAQLKALIEALQKELDESKDEG